MRRSVAIAFVIGCLNANAIHAATDEMHAALDNGVRACEAWVLKPKSWAEDVAGFPHNAGISVTMTPIGGLPPGVLPDGLAAALTNFWHIDAGAGNGVFVAASANQPLCNVVGGGPADYQPEAERLINAAGFGKNWQHFDHQVHDDMVSDTFKAAGDEKAKLIISRAGRAGARTDRVQFMATLIRDTGK